ncbi:hypothetical protein LAZ67_18001880 [Cordylochernes scorpioides]|uniref:Uncharacterized protein n=1 Tax=Cordylochernes scorpioides TaxID=51811 RepID=A0ABY6LJY2_9ARAC|nr:hypothetical protein LAZ67_18001880 [Cordylochernes scorpioides]
MGVFSDGLLYVESKLLYREDREESEHFRRPFLLPHKHSLVDLMIREEHLRNNHAGTHILMLILREKFWIIKSRKPIGRIVRGCVKCRRFDQRPIKIPYLPGPLYLKDGSKVWMVLFTCAVYRAIHFEMVSSLETDSFILALSRFIGRRGRPSTIYSDNGTNLVGTRNLFAHLKWDKIVKETQEQRISWKLNPPRAAWWGGFWERMIRMIKKPLKENIRELQQRFRKEYLGLLVQKGKEVSGFKLIIGEIVLIGNDDQKRIDWPMAKIEELISGRDGKIRVARVKTTRGILMRPIQKIYPLEVTSEEDMALLCSHKEGGDITDSPVTKSRQDSGRQGTSKQVDHCLYRKMEQGREEDPKEPMESDPDSESGENTFPKKENTLGRTQEVPPGQEDVTPPPPVSDVLGRSTTTLHQLSAVTGHRERWNRYDGSYEAQSFFTNYDAQADRAQLQYSTSLKKPPDLLQAPLRVTNTRASRVFVCKYYMPPIVIKSTIGPTGEKLCIIEASLITQILDKCGIEYKLEETVQSKKRTRGSQSDDSRSPTRSERNLKTSRMDIGEQSPTTGISQQMNADHPPHDDDENNDNDGSWTTVTNPTGGKTTESGIEGVNTTAFKEEDVVTELVSMGFTEVIVKRLHRQSTKIPMNIVLVELPKNEQNKRIYGITEIIYQKIVVESFRTTKRVTQCFNCQGFGHGQLNCFLKPKCVKCAEEYHSKDCPRKSKQLPPKCANCGEAHTANYRGCPNFPKPQQQQLKPPRQNSPNTIPQASSTKTEEATVDKQKASYAETAKKKTTRSDTRELETHLKPSVDLKLRNYQTIRDDRIVGRGGGTAIILKNYLKYKKLLIQTSNMENTTILMKPDGRAVVQISSIYKKPDLPLLDEDLNLLLENNQSVIAAGDWNSKHPLWGSRTSNNSGTVLHNFSEKESLDIVAPSSPTHYSPLGNPDFLNIAILRNIPWTSRIKTLDALSSDHLPVILELTCPKDEFTTSACRLTNWVHFQQDLISSTPPRVPLKTEANIDSAVTILNDKIYNSYSKNTVISSSSSKQIEKKE